MQTYRVFKRNPWRRDASWPDGWAPNSGARKLTVRRGLSLDDARALCRQGPANKALKAGEEYRGKTFYEFEQE
jgi:hypothetical protein